MKFDELYKKVIDSCRAFEERRVPISLDFKIEDLRDALVESNDTIEKLKAENEHLKKMSSCKFSDDCLRVRQLKAKLESVQASAYADSVDAGMRERRLRRALWLARSLRARDIQRWWIAVTCAPITERACSVWNNVERKCLKKAEEYK